VIHFSSWDELSGKPDRDKNEVSSARREVRSQLKSAAVTIGCPLEIRTTAHP